MKTQFKNIFKVLCFLLIFNIQTVYNEEEFEYIRILEEGQVINQNCNETQDPENAKKCTIENMVCEENSVNCNCTDEYFTDPKNISIYCNLKRKKQLTAFLLELFVGFGAGHFYRCSYLMASLKLVAFFLGIYVICLFPLTAKCVTDCCDSDCLVVLVSIFFYLYALGLAFWYIFDLVRFGKNMYQDKRYNVDLMHW